MGYFNLFWKIVGNSAAHESQAEPEKGREPRSSLAGQRHRHFAKI